MRSRWGTRNKMTSIKEKHWLLYYLSWQKTHDSSPASRYDGPTWTGLLAVSDDRILRSHWHWYSVMTQLIQMSTSFQKIDFTGIDRRQTDRAVTILPLTMPQHCSVPCNQHVKKHCRSAHMSTRWWLGEMACGRRVALACELQWNRVPAYRK